MSIEQISEMYHSAYQYDSQDDRARESYAEIAAAICEVLHPVRAFDVGCGGGSLIRGLLAQGVEATGVDGSLHAAAFMPDRIWNHDLRYPMLSMTQRPPADMVTCFDVAEHIEEEYADQVVRTCVQNSGIWILFGPALDGQDGLGHVNCQHPTYWIEKFEEQGCKLDSRVSNQLRAVIKAKPHANHLWWVAQNVMVFYRCGQL